MSKSCGYGREDVSLLKYKRQTFRALLVDFLPFLFVFLLIGGGMYFSFLLSFRERIASDKHEVLARVAAEMERSFELIIRHGQNTFADSQVAEAVRERQTDEMRETLRAMVIGMDNLEHAAVTTPEGTVWVTYPHSPEIEGENFADRDWYRQVSQEGQPAVSEFFLRLTKPQRYTIVVAIPLKSGGEVSGILVLQPALGVLFAPLRAPLGQGFIYAVDKNGHLVFRYGKTIDRMIDYSSVPAVQRALAGGEGHGVFYNSLEKEERMAAWIMMEEYGIGLIAKEPTSVAFAPVRRLAAMVLVSLLTLLFFAVLVFYRLVVAREQGRDLNERLCRRAELERGLRDVLLLVNEPGQDLKNFAARFLEVLVERSKGWTGIFYLLSENGTLNPLVSQPHQAGAPSFPLGEGLPGMAAKQGRILRTGEIAASTRMSLATGHGELSPQEIIVLPLRHDDQELGAIELGVPEKLDEDILAYLGMAVDKVAASMVVFHTRNELESQRLLTQLIMDSVPDLVSLCNVHGTYLTVNRALSDMLGKAPQQIIGLTYSDLLAPEIAERFQAQDEEVLRTGEMLVVDEETMFARSGRQLRLMTIKTPVLSADGQVTSIVSVARDVTRLKEAEARLQQYVEELQQHTEELQTQQLEMRVLMTNLEEASQAKSKFLAAMSHELRTPLSAIMGFSEVLLDQLTGSLTEKQLEYARNINASGHHLLDLINDVLDFARVEAGKMTLEYDKFDPALAVKQTVDMVSEAAEKKKIALSLQVEASCPAVVTADERKFKQVLLNLLSNAVKFTPLTGAVHVLVSLVTDRRGPQFPLEEFLQVEVRDTGPGIDAKGQEKLFQEFSQLEASAEKTAGSGLGLVLSKRLVELHSGRIWLASEPGKGSRFIFAIPVRRSVAPKE